MKREYVTLPVEAVRQMTSASLQVYCALRMFTNRKGECFPGYDKLMEITGQAKATLAKAIKLLDKAGWIQRRKRFNGTTVYTVLTNPSSSKSEQSRSSKTELMEFNFADTKYNSSSNSEFCGMVWSICEARIEKIPFGGVPTGDLQKCSTRLKMKASRNLSRWIRYHSNTETDVISFVESWHEYYAERNDVMSPKFDKRAGTFALFVERHEHFCQQVEIYRNWKRMQEKIAEFPASDYGTAHT